MILREENTLLMLQCITDLLEGFLGNLVVTVSIDFLDEVAVDIVEYL
jgi:hypothetical protein